MIVPDESREPCNKKRAPVSNKELQLAGLIDKQGNALRYFIFNLKINIQKFYFLHNLLIISYTIISDYLKCFFKQHCL